MIRMGKQQVVILAISTALLLGFSVFRYIPLLRKNMNAKKEITTHSQAIADIQQYAGRLPELRHEKQQLEQRLQQYPASIPQGKQFARLWQQIADVMNDCQLAEQSVQPGAEQVSDELCCIPLTIECTGTLDQMFAFFQSLEQLDRQVHFQDVELQNSTDFDAMVKLNAKANVYYQPKPAEKS